jgi:hypothetical protein
MRAAAAVSLLALVACAAGADDRSTGRASQRPVAAAEDAPCASDADCATTRVDEGGCCPALCLPRVVTRRRAAELEAKAPACNGGLPCPQPSCTPPRVSIAPVCEAARCVARTSPTD